MSKIEFFIKGLNNSPVGFYPEIDAAYEFAKNNNIKAFDTLLSPLHNEILIEVAQSIGLDIVLLSLFSMLKDYEAMHNIVLDFKIIKTAFLSPIFSELQKTNNVDISMPISIKSFNKNMQNKYGADMLELLKHTADYMLLLHSNRKSPINLLKYLNENGDIEEVYSLIGGLHLDMLDKHGAVKLSSSTHREIEIILENRNVTLYLFGGNHKETFALNEMMDNFKQHHPEFFVESHSVDKNEDQINTIISPLELPGNDDSYEYDHLT